MLQLRSFLARPSRCPFLLSFSNFKDYSKHTHYIETVAPMTNIPIIQELLTSDKCVHSLSLNP